MKRALNQKGIILITVYSVVVIILALVLPMLPKIIGEYRVAERARNSAQALYLAEAGKENAIYRLGLDSDYIPPNAYAILGNGEYTMTIIKDGLPSGQRKIITTGYVPNHDPNSYGYQTVTLETYAQIKEKPLFANAAFSQNETELKNTVSLDSYNSSLGNYGGDNIGSQGNIATNAVTVGAITLKHGSNVSGSATIGAGGNPDLSIEIEDSAFLSGAKQAAAENTQLPALPVPPGSVSSNIKIKGTTVVTLGEGTYWYKSVNIAEQAKVVLEGPAVINSLGNVKIGGNGIETYENLPANLTINVVNDGDSDVEYKSDQNFYGCIYAPNNKVKLSGSGQIFGAIIGDEIKASDSVKIHYDTALEDEGGGIGYTIDNLSWRQQ